MSILRYARSLVIVLAGFLPLLTNRAEGLTVLDTQPSWNGVETSWFPFGEPESGTYGQTFTVSGSDTKLESFQFWFDDRFDSFWVDFVDFAAYLYAWDGVKATGPQLFASDMVSTTNNHGAGGVEGFLFNTGGINLVSGAQYVAFVSAVPFFDGSNGGAAMGGVAQAPDSYAGGSFVWQNNQSVNTWTTTDWLRPQGSDAKMVAVFTPEPDTGLLVVTGLLGLSWRTRRHTVEDSRA